jgi:hypothetical protein
LPVVAVASGPCKAYLHIAGGNVLKKELVAIKGKGLPGNGNSIIVVGSKCEVQGRSGGEIISISVVIVVVIIKAGGPPVALAKNCGNN